MTELSTRNKIIIVVAYTLACVAGGRYLSPTKIKIETVTVKEETKTENKNEKITTDADRKKHTDKTVTEITRPDGTKETTTKTVEDTDARRSSDRLDTGTVTDDKTEISKTSKTIERQNSRTSLSALAGVNPFDLTGGMHYGASIQKEILGPFTLGAFVLTPGIVGLSAGINL